MLYPDSGATNHITTDPGNITTHIGTEGNVSITIANGSPLPITNSGYSVFTLQDNDFRMNNILLVPNATKNLMSVKCLCLDNSISFVFDSSKVMVKEVATGKVLLEG